MLSKDNRLRVSEIACRIQLGREVSLTEMIWYNKMIENNGHARGIHERTVTKSSFSSRYWGDRKAQGER